MSWLEHLGNNLIKRVEMSIGDDKTICEVVEDNNTNKKMLHIDRYYNNVLQSTEKKRR